MIRRGAALLVAGVLVAACSGGGDSSDTVATAPTLPITTLPAALPTTTTPESTVAPTTTVWDGPLYPLTGLPAVDPVAAARPALVVKIDNHPDARPQTGLGVADIVYEENVEGITRFAAAFHSQGSDPVGPIRSGRTQDVSLLGSLNEPLFAWSGGNPSVNKAIADSDLVNLSNLISSVAAQGGFFRDPNHKAPHNLYAQTTDLWNMAPTGAVPPQPQFTFREAGVAPAGDQSAGARIDMDGVRVDWQWNGSGYARLQNGEPHTDEVSGPITADNVVVLVVQYRPSPADARSPEAQTVGSGEAFVFTAGTIVRGTWSRADRLQPFVLTDGAGAVIELTPGRTWVEMARRGTVIPA